MDKYIHQYYIYQLKSHIKKIHYEMEIITQEDFDKRAAELKKILLGN